MNTWQRGEEREGEMILQGCVNDITVVSPTKEMNETSLLERVWGLVSYSVCGGTSLFWNMSPKLWIISSVFVDLLLAFQVNMTLGSSFMFVWPLFPPKSDRTSAPLQADCEIDLKSIRGENLSWEGRLHSVHYSQSYPMSKLLLNLKLGFSENDEEKDHHVTRWRSTGWAREERQMGLSNLCSESPSLQ